MINKNFYKEFNKGWNNLFEELLKELDQYDVEIIEAKEKYGTLTVYAHSKDNDDEVQSIIDKYEEKSKHICEFCGDKGTIKTEHGWTKVLCEECTQSRRSKS